MSSITRTNLNENFRKNRQYTHTTTVEDLMRFYSRDGWDSTRGSHPVPFNKLLFVMQRQTKPDKQIIESVSVPFTDYSKLYDEGATCEDQFRALVKKLNDGVTITLKYKYQNEFQTKEITGMFMPRYKYNMVKLDYLRYPIELAVMPAGKTNFYTAMQSRSGNLLPNECWQAVDFYNGLIKQAVYQLNWEKHAFAIEEHNYRLIWDAIHTFDNYKYHISIPKQYSSQWMYEDQILNETQALRPGHEQFQCALPIEYVKTYVQKYAKAYDIDVPYLTYKGIICQDSNGMYYTRPQVNFCPTVSDKIQFAQSKHGYESYLDEIPIKVKQEAALRTLDIEPDWYNLYQEISILKENKLLAPDYEFCPVCGEPYNIKVGCPGDSTDEQIFRNDFSNYHMDPEFLATGYSLQDFRDQDFDTEPVEEAF